MSTRTKRRRINAVSKRRGKGQQSGNPRRRISSKEGRAKRPSTGGDKPKTTRSKGPPRSRACRVGNTRVRSRVREDKGTRVRLSKGGTQTDALSEGTRAIRVTEESAIEGLSIVRRNMAELPVSRIKGLKIAVANQEEIALGTRITNSAASGENSVNDPRTGVVERDLVCPTCLQGVTCTGHPGYIELVQPVLHPSYIRDIIKILKVVCNSCSALLISKEDAEIRGIMKYAPELRLKKLEAASKDLTCSAHHGTGCAQCNQNPIFVLKKSNETGSVQIKSPGGQGSTTLPVKTIKDILDGISDEDAKTLGFEHGAHPRNFVITYLPVTPPQTRPSSIQDGNVKPDNLTNIYGRIVNANNAIKQASNKGDPVGVNKAKVSLVDAIKSLICKSEGSKVKGLGGRGNLPEIISGKERYC